jgi:hypothetical protein
MKRLQIIWSFYYVIAFTPVEKLKLYNIWKKDLIKLKQRI